MAVPILYWRDVDKYPPANSSLVRWAWEFLRRNERYQLDYEEYLDACRKIVPEVQRDTGGDISSRLLADPRFWSSHDPPILESESHADWLERVGGGSNPSLMDYYALKWGLDLLVDPLAEGDGGFLAAFASFTDQPLLRFPGAAAESIETRHQGAQVALEFDVRRPLAPQLEIAQRFLYGRYQLLVGKGSIQPWPSVRVRSEMYPNYVRVLDAVAAGASFEEMAELMLPHVENTYPTYAATKSVRNWLKAARDLCGNYRCLTALKR